MDVKSVLEVVREFGSKHNASFRIPQRGWNFRDSARKHNAELEGSGSPGIYLFCDPDVADVNTPMEESLATVWYVGMSQPRMANRIWRHMGEVRNPVTNEPWPPFTTAKWLSRTNVEARIKDRISDGSVLVYCIALDESSAYLAPAIESFVRARILEREHRYPPLNKNR